MPTRDRPNQGEKHFGDPARVGRREPEELMGGLETREPRLGASEMAKPQNLLPAEVVSRPLAGAPARPGQRMAAPRQQGAEPARRDPVWMIDTGLGIVAAGAVAALLLRDRQRGR